MITQSGCFGQSRTPDPIDDINEAAEALGDIMGSASQQPPTTDATGAAMPALAALVGQYARRMRLLTWAVVAIVAYLVLKEL